jgi:hypothetical protein
MIHKKKFPFSEKKSFSQAENEMHSITPASKSKTSELALRNTREWITPAQITNYGGKELMPALRESVSI